MVQEELLISYIMQRIHNDDRAIKITMMACELFNFSLPVHLLYVYESV